MKWRRTRTVKGHLESINKLSGKKAASGSRTLRWWVFHRAMCQSTSVAPGDHTNIFETFWFFPITNRLQLKSIPLQSMCDDDDVADSLKMRGKARQPDVYFLGFSNHLQGDNRLWGEIEYLQTPTSAHSWLRQHPQPSPQIFHYSPSTPAHSFLLGYQSHPCYSG